ncbi:MAG: sigma-70 family RNA polymerase sigma factor [Planctomycetota bacterium]
MKAPAPDPAVLQRLLASHREFLAFLTSRVGDRTLAEDLLQDAFVKSLEKGSELRAGESARAWFYRVLRNAVVDRHRRDSAAARRLDQLAIALDDRASEASAAADRTACACIGQLLDNLPAAQAHALRRVELEGSAVNEFARETGISETNAGVRLFRARAALRAEVLRACGTCAEHGCVDCCCRDG